MTVTLGLIAFGIVLVSITEILSYLSTQLLFLYF